jgi:hypothetical protein
MSVGDPTNACYLPLPHPTASRSTTMAVVIARVASPVQRGVKVHEDWDETGDDGQVGRMGKRVPTRMDEVKASMTEQGVLERKHFS